MKEKFLRISEVRVRSGLPKSTIYGKMAEGSFPKSIKLSTWSVAWIESEVEAWIQERIQMSRPQRTQKNKVS